MMKSILDYAPGALRSSQEQTLLWLEENWDLFDVFVINAPTSAGKSWIALTLARWLEAQELKTAIVTPTKQLQDQYSEEFPQYPCLKGKASYQCKELEDFSCADTYDACEGYCGSCTFPALRFAAEKHPISFFNYYTYIYNEIFLQKDVAIFDEAHGITPMLSSLSELRLWQHKEGFPDSVTKTHGDLVMWLSGYYERLQDRKRELFGSYVPAEMRERAALSTKCADLNRLIVDLQHHHGDFYYSIETSLYRGKKERMLKVVPLSVCHLPPRLWPKFGKVQKLVMMSATISHKSVAEMGLGGRKIGFIASESPIPIERRPFVIDPCASMAWTKRKAELPKIVERIEEYAERHKNDKGLIHVTYALAKELYQYLGDNPRFIWHNQQNKQQKYADFRATDLPKILVASGMQEGIDLVGDAGRWQVILALPYPSYADGWVKSKMQFDPTWYGRTTALLIMQMAGRICRTPQDWGVTYCIDNRFMDFYYRHLSEFARWFQASLTVEQPDLAVAYG